MTAALASSTDFIGIARDPQWLPHRYDPGHDAIHFIPVPRDMHRATTFLIDDHLPAGLNPVVLRRDHVMATGPQAAPIHFLFHSGYCCSTLLSRAVDRPGWAMGLKEPMILNDMVGWRRRGGQGPDMASVLDNVLTLLARPFAPGETVVVKPSTVINALAPAILALRPDACAIMMYAPLRTYLASIAKKGIDGRRWVRTLLTGMLDDNMVQLGFSTRDYLEQTDLQVAALGWLAQQQLYAGMVDRYGAARVRTLDSSRLLADPAAAMVQLGTLFRRSLSAEEAQAVARGPAFTRHSKSGEAFGTAERDAEHRDAAAVHADELHKVAEWAAAVAQSAGITLDAPAPLIG